jgi:hypothetical protein
VDNKTATIGRKIIRRQFDDSNKLNIDRIKEDLQSNVKRQRTKGRVIRKEPLPTPEKLNLDILSTEMPERPTLYKSTRKTNTKEFKQRQDLLFQLQREYDLFPTPENLTKEIIDDFMKRNNKEDVYNILEPSMGLGSLLIPFIDRQKEISINKMDGIEYSKDLFNVVKDKINISNYYNADFLEFKQQRPYNLIIMNPPYRGYVNFPNKTQSEKEVYWYHIIKALMLEFANYDKTIYLICPRIHKDNIDKDSKQRVFYPSINESLQKRLKEYFNIDTDEDILSEFGGLQFEMLKESKGEFTSFDKHGRPTPMSYTLYLYKIYQCCTNAKIEIEG